MSDQTQAYLVLVPEIGYTFLTARRSEMSCVKQGLEKDGYTVSVKELIERPTTDRITEGNEHD